MGRRGFALPTILIASIVMLSVLLVAVSSTTATRTALLNQYYQQLAHAAGDAGIAYATACLNANGGVPQWSNAKPLMPNTDCTGTSLPGVTCPDGVTTFFTVTTPAICSVTLNGIVRSSFSLGLPTVQDASVLVVGGGGGGGSAGSGGGAGGYVYTPSFSFSTGSYPVVVGAGGTGGTGHGVPGASGGSSSIATITGQGGGAGIPLADGFAYGTANGTAGGSGGGGAITTAAPTSAGGLGSQGNNGGAGYAIAGWTGGSGGGGGAGSAGTAGGNSSGAGNGGAGLANSITGTSLFYAAGGGAGEINGSFVGTGGSSIGGSGVLNAAGTNGTANTGSGGGGGSYNGTYFNGGNGGSGVVIVRYPTGLLTATGGTITTSGGYTIHTFTGSGTFTVTAVTSAVKTLPNTGFVQLLRQSTGAVWRTYTQQATQEAVPPALCSGAATTDYGWTNVLTTTGGAFADATAFPVSLSSGSIGPGPVYYRKDFNVAHAGTYTLATLSNSSVNWSIDSQFAGQGTSTSQSVTLTGGCHTIYAVSNNTGIRPTKEYITASLKLSGAVIPLVVTDASWRVSAGVSYNYATPNFYTDSTSWTVARDYTAATAYFSSWASVSGDSTARAINTTHSYDGSNNYPSASFADFRDSRTVTVATPTQVKISYGCDDNCYIYLDGNQIAANTIPGSATYSTTVTLTEGTHQFAAALYNTSGVSTLGIVVTRVSDGTVLTRTDQSWLATTSWSQIDFAPSSYDAFFAPYPALPSVTAQVLVVGGGGGGGSSSSSNGGGGGGGGGGVLYNSAYTLSVGSMAITVGSGGSGGASGAGQTGTNGGNSTFGTLTAIGGGGGGNGTSASVNSGLPGGSAGGAGYNGYVVETITYGILGQGYEGGQNGATSGAGGGGGGGAGHAGYTPTNSPLHNGGVGGAGISNSITGSATYYGGGGGGSDSTDSGNGTGGAGGGGAGKGTNGTANTGGGGGGRYSSFGAAGSGGSGVVIISYPTCSGLTTTGGTVTTSGSNTIVTFTSSGTFTISAINSTC